VWENAIRMQRDELSRKAGQRRDVRYKEESINQESQSKKLGVFSRE
jgi:hypothetical protein